MGFVVPPSKWEIQHARAIFSAQNYQAANNGQLPDTRAWRMLEFRHDLNPTRFTFYHPNVSRMIEAQRIVPPTVPDVEAPVGQEVPPPIVVDPSPDAPPIVVAPPIEPPTGQEIKPPLTDNQDAPAVPEPGTFLMLVVAVLTVGLFFQHSKRRTR